MRVDDGRAVPAFMKQAITGQPLTVYGDGSQTRSFCYVSDTVNGLISLLTHRPKTGDRLVMNIGNPEEVTVLQLAREVIGVTGSPSEIVFEELPQDDPKLRRPDISRAREVLGWEPRVSRTEGLKKVLPHVRETLALKEAA
jgi:nucleoside-diphosphate-sugar epimerase